MESKIPKRAKSVYTYVDIWELEAGDADDKGGT
jgi:hypothetical protein